MSSGSSLTRVARRLGARDRRSVMLCLRWLELLVVALVISLALVVMGAVANLPWMAVEGGDGEESTPTWERDVITTATVVGPSPPALAGCVPQTSSSRPRHAFSLRTSSRAPPLA
jgi:hypothetical protein